GALFGHFGDRVGRKATLVASLLLMGGSTALVAVLPTFASIGWWAPALLCLLRVGQGIGLGGEWSGAALLAVENAPPGWRGRFGSVPQQGAPMGFWMANGFFLILGAVLTPQQFRDWGWRVPFAASTALIAVGLWVRLRLAETASFRAAMAEAPPPRVPMAELLRHHGRAVVAGTLGVVICFSLFYLATAFALGWGTGHGANGGGFGRQNFLGVQMAAIGAMAAGIALAGWLSDRAGPRPVLMGGCVLAVASGALLGPMLGSGSLLLAFGFLGLALLAMGLVYGPLGAWLPGLFPARVRYTGSALAFNLGGVLGGALTPALAQWLTGHGGIATVGVYLAATAAVSIAGVALAGRPRAAAEDPVAATS
ncbi:MAG: MFS transporter, partial [Gluconacetobacter diazotrophicus]|nr:MFS transporter [Gluconacetobacter diazotrophicus]